MMKILALILLTSCSLSQINRQTSFEKDLFNDETLLRFNSVAIKQLSESQDIKLSSLAQCHQGESKEGLKKLQGHYAKFKKDPFYWNIVGTCYYLGEQMPKASFYFQHALNLSKRSKARAYTFNNLGVILLKQRHYDQAFEMFTKSMKINKSLVTPKFNLAQLHIQFGQIQEATRLLNELLEKEPEDLDVLTSLAVISMIDEDYKHAIAIYEKFEEEQIKRADIAGYYALSLYKDGQYNRAKEVLEEQNVSTEEAFFRLNRELKEKIKVAIRHKEQQENL
jgi:tetratricopeptide (TPR) repeat protein